jgi:dTDP-4-amino-4,6-dideoxygalactose transaminase
MTHETIPLVDLRRQYAAIGAELEPEVLAVLRSGNYIMGKKVAQFEGEFAGCHDAAHCVGVSTGTDALHVALWALGVGPADEVIVPVNTFVATAEAVSLTGARVAFVDHDSHYNLDPEDVLRKLTDKTRAVIAVHLYGQPAAMDKIRAICSENSIDLVEDCAQAHLARYHDQSVGTFGRAGCFSFYPGKNLGACGEGGAVVTNDKTLFERMARLRQHGISTNRYHHDEPGHNYRMEEIQAAVLSIKLRHLPEWTRLRRAHAALYRELLAGVSQVECPAELPHFEHVYHLFVIQAERRDELLRYLNERKIGAGLHYPTPLHLQPAYAALGYHEGDFPVAERTSARILSLPMFPELTRDEIEYICSSIRTFFAGRRA